MFFNIYTKATIFNSINQYFFSILFSILEKYKIV